MKVCLFRTTFYWPIRVQLETYSSHYNFHPFSLWKIITLQRITVFCMWKAYHFDRWSLNYITLIHCQGTICQYETLLYSAIFCKNKLSKYYYTRLMEYFIKYLCPNFFLSFVFYTENQLFVFIPHYLFPLLYARGPKLR